LPTEAFYEINKHGNESDLTIFLDVWSVQAQKIFEWITHYRTIAKLGKVPKCGEITFA
jgi:hypothetical protein